MAPWQESPSLEFNLAKPHAERFARLPLEAIEKGRMLLEAVMQDVPDIARMAIPLVQQRTNDRFQPEVEALADAFDLDWRDILLANISYDLTIGVLGCSTVALPTPAGPVVARNMDWFPERPLAHASYLLHNHRNGEPAFANAGWPGSIGAVTGMSAKGFGIVLNAVISPEKSRTDGYPVMLYIRRVLEEAAGYEEALEMLTHEVLATSALITVVGSENDQRAVVERSPSRHAVRHATGDTPLVATNDYRKLYATTTHDSNEIYQTTCTRYDEIHNFFSGHRQDDEVSDDKLLYLLSSENVMQSITAQHIIMRPRENYIRLLNPRRCFEDAVV